MISTSAMITVAGCPKPANTAASEMGAADVGNDQGAERDDVVSHPPPQEQAEDRDEHREQK